MFNAHQNSTQTRIAVSTPLKKLFTLSAIALAMGAAATPVAMAAAGTDSIRPAPRPAAVVECHNAFGSIWICQAKWANGSSEWVCDTVSRQCIKQ
jgi:hypothetical protein